MALGYTRRQWLTLIVISIADFCNAICVSLQAPFYPQEAEKKGATAIEYGIVFGIFELVVFLISPFYGQYLNRVGPKVLFNGGIFTTGTCAILFGLLDRVEGHAAFIGLSITIRIVEALGNAAFLTASFAIIAKEFPDNVATTFASLETFFGLGLIVGPTVGGCLYSVGGYTTPFAVLGSALFLSAIMTALVLPKHDADTDPSENGPSMLKVLRIPGVFVCAMSIAATSLSIGFLSATLEPHLRVFGLSPIILGLMFIINGGVYALTAPVYGWMCDKLIVLPKVVSFSGCILVAAGFMLIGPAPCLPFEANLWVIVGGLVLHGFGISAQLVASFSDALNTAIGHGMPNNIETYGLVSGLWTSTFALGAFAGPCISGALFDTIGFNYSTLFVIGLHLLMAFIIATFMFIDRRPRLFTQMPPTMPLKGSQSSLLISENGSVKSLKGAISNGISIERIAPPNRPGAMNSLLACNSGNSYKKHQAQWARSEPNGLGTYYGSVERMRPRYQESYA